MKKSLKRKLYIIIFRTDTPLGKAFDVGLLVTILLSVSVVMLESVEQYSAKYADLFLYAEWTFTILFTAEYALRIFITEKKRKYIFSFFGIIDLLSTLPAYLALLFTGMHALIILRSFRLMRVFRILKLARFIGEESQLSRALKASRAKITVFLVAVFIIVVVMGTVMYLVEGAKNGFTSIPASIYWAIVTLTTVGYGDIAPATVLGQTLASIIMIMGYGIIAVPTGIVTAEMAKAGNLPDPNVEKQNCDGCGATIADPEANYCKFCGTSLE
ncbi:MAG: ion transporter [Bacteroidota bacterium]